MDNNYILTMEQALEAVGIKTKENGEYRLFDDVMNDLREKWNSLTVDEKQRVANMFVRYFL